MRLRSSPIAFRARRLSLRDRILLLTSRIRFCRSRVLLVEAAHVTDGSARIEDFVYFYDAAGRPLFEGFSLLSWNGWQEKQREDSFLGLAGTPWRAVRQVEGWSTYCVYNPYLRLEDYVEVARRHARGLWGHLADEKRIELRLSVMSQSETNFEVRRQMSALFSKRPV
jgi:hypothetical protein